VNEPGVFEQAAFALQLCVFNVHSLVSVQLIPLPVYPTLHAHVNEPWPLVHTALA
jgi:hypothetical protein